MRGPVGPPAAEGPAPGAEGPTSGSQTPLQRPMRPNGERLPARQRLLRRADYLRCYRTGRRRMGALAILYFAPSPLGYPRIGITASRKVGNAVVRHRLKRRIKEIYRRWPGRGGLAAIDLVVHLKPEAKGAGFDDMARDLLGLLGGVARRQRGDRRETRA